MRRLSRSITAIMVNIGHRKLVGGVVRSYFAVVEVSSAAYEISKSLMLTLSH